MTAVKLLALIMTLAPAVREAVTALVKALRDDDDAAARAAYEAARRAAFVARQKGVIR